MTEFLQATIDGLGDAAVLALVALGFVIIYKATQVLSFAQPGLTILGGYWVVYFATVLTANFWLALGLALIVSFLIGVGIERVFLRPMVGKPVFAVAILTIGLDLVIRVFAGDLLGVNIRQVGDPWGIDFYTAGGLTVTQRDLAAIVMAAIAVTALLLFFKYTRFGLGMRATAFDQEVSLAHGVPVRMVFAVAWGIAAALAAVAGMFFGVGVGLSPIVFVAALAALPVVVIGGLDSIAGAVVAAVIVGLASSYTVAYQPTFASFLGTGFSTIVPYLIMFVVLLVRPYGLFGTPEVERV